MDVIRSRFQHQFIAESHRRYHNHHQQLEQAGEKTKMSDDGKSVTTSGCSSVYDVIECDDDDEVKRVHHSPSSDVISSLHHSSSYSPSALCRPHIHRPFEDAPVTLQQRFVGRDDRRQEERRQGWLAHRHYQLGSVDSGSESWKRDQLSFGDDEVGSSGDSACCDDDDVTDVQVLGEKMNSSRHDTEVHSDITSDGTTPLRARSELYHHCQPQHGHKPGLLWHC